MPFAERAGARVYYELRGNQEGQTLVLVRGLGRNALHWGEVLGELERDFHLVLIDNRGMGRSESARWPFTITTLSDDVEAVLDAAGISRAHLLGMSLGGMVALRFALDHAGRLDRLVLLSTTAGGGSSPPPIAPFARMAAAARLPLREGVAIQARVVMGGRFVADNPGVVEAWAAVDERYPVVRRALLYQALAVKLHDVSRELWGIGAPTLVMTCERDALVPPENSRRLARGIRCAELCMLPGDSHDVTTAYPQRSARVIREFLLRDGRA